MLKSLQLDGFKSFAEPTRFDFPEGVTVIVGPNGSGKSNVVDAVKWVLGSQSARGLRGREMTDVIFAGSESRAAMASAEVTLAFDNPPAGEGERRLFDVDETEVRFTRRVLRSGDGAYLVNGRPCRLRDFRELLAGTGAGPTPTALSSRDGLTRPSTPRPWSDASLSKRRPESAAFDSRRRKRRGVWSVSSRTCCGSRTSSTRSRGGCAGSAPKRAKHAATARRP